MAAADHRRTLSFGSLVAFLEYVQRFYKPVQDLAEKFNISSRHGRRGAHLRRARQRAGDHGPGRPLPAGRARGAVEFRTSASPTGREKSPARHLAEDRTGEMVAIVGANRRREDLDHQPAGAAVRPAGRRRPARRPRPQGLRASATCTARWRSCSRTSPLLRDDPRNISLGTRDHEEAVEEAARLVGADTSSAGCRGATTRRSAERGALLSSGRSSCSRSPGARPRPALLILDEATPRSTRKRGADQERWRCFSPVARPSSSPRLSTIAGRTGS